MKKSWKKFLPLVICLALCMSLFTVSASAAAPSTRGDVVQDGDNWVAKDKDGKVIKNGWVSYTWQEDGGKTHKDWFYAKDGVLLDGWQNIDGEWYFFNNAGEYPVMYSNELVYNDSYGDYENSKEWLDAKDAWWVNADGSLRVDNSGWASEMGKAMDWTTGEIVPHRWFYFVNSDGSLYKGWMSENGTWYAMDPEMIQGTKGLYNGGYHYPGIYYDNDILNAEDYAELPNYWINPDGSVATGWTSYMTTKIVDGKEVPYRQFYYADPEAYGALASGWKQIEGKWYFFVPQDLDNFGWNRLVTGEDIELDGVTYRLDKSGAMVTGWSKGADGNWNYFDANGAEVQDSWKQIDGKWYYFDGADLIDYGRFEYDGDYYYAGRDGAIVSGWVQDNVNEPWHYYNDQGVEQYGWVEDGGNWYYLDDNGELVTNEWLDDDVYVGSDGAWVEWTPETAD